MDAGSNSPQNSRFKPILDLVGPGPHLLWFGGPRECVLILLVFPKTDLGELVVEMGFCLAS